MGRVIVRVISLEARMIVDGRCSSPAALFAATTLLFGTLTGCAVGELPDDAGGDSASSTDRPEPPELSDERERKLDEELDALQARGKADGHGRNGFAFYRSSYENMVVAGTSRSGDDFALIAGTHSHDFPFQGDRPWDNGLLYVDGEGYHFTHRERGRALELAIETDAIRSTGRIHYSGRMKRASDGERVRIEISIPVDARRHREHQLGRPYDFLPGDAAEKFAGMTWRPFELEADRGTISVDGRVVETVDTMHGEIEHGELVNVKLDRFAFAYDYVSLASPDEDGYAFIDFQAVPLNPNGALGYVLKRYMKWFASATMTLDDGYHPGNVFDVDRPPQDDETVVMFENEVDLELATLRRQMVKTRDADGDVVYGLREIFERKKDDGGWF